jgi:simple sugar transport system ATP-binding protein
MPSTPLVRLDSISKSYAGIRALSDVSFAIEAGEVVCLAGENGSGKSTVIKILAGVEPPTAGKIVIDGQETALDPRSSVARGIQVIFQDFALFPNLSVAENIAFSAEIGSHKKLVDRQRMRALAASVLKRVEVDIRLDARVESLPVADKQLVAIARALALDARLVIMDEPTTALTQREVQSLLATILRLKSEGVAVLFVSHKLAEIFEVCDKIVVLRNGAIVSAGPTAEFDLDSLAFHMTGRHFLDSVAEPFDETVDPVLEVKGLGWENLLHDISFTLKPGEVLGVAGRLGSGRTQLAKALFGLVPPDRGEIRLEGKPLTLRSPLDAIHAGIGYVPEDRLTEGLFLTQSVARNISIGRLGAFAKVFGWLDRSGLAAESGHWLRRLNVMAPNVSAPVRWLSGGNQQRVVLARWLAKKPRILILNGPTVGIDIGSKVDIHQIIAGLSAEKLGTIVISDDLPELLACCHRILVMKGGRIVNDIASSKTSERALADELAS